MPITVTPGQAAALNEGPITVACKMEQPPEGWSFRTLSRPTAMCAIFTDGLTRANDIEILTPHPRDSEVEVQTAPSLYQMVCGFETDGPIHVCTARVTDVSVVQEDGRWVALTTIEGKK